MKQITSKIAYFCVGIWDLGRENLGLFVTKMIARGKKSMQTETGIIEEGAEEEEALFTRIKELIQKIIKATGSAGRTELEALESRVAALENHLKSGGDNDKLLDS